MLDTCVDQEMIHSYRYRAIILGWFITSRLTFYKTNTQSILHKCSHYVLIQCGHTYCIVIHLSNKRAISRGSKPASFSSGQIKSVSTFQKSFKI